ncbi:NAD(P)-binding protein [Atractiella rhizophila]|nr:NAD(P)-binding protein [Atractiella rhizophila]
MLGVGKNIAVRYASRGARVVLVARREKQLQEVVQECGGTDRVKAFVGDFTNIDDLVRLKGFVEKLGGLDTLHIIAGVSALRPIMDIRSATSPDSLSANLSNLSSITSSAVSANFLAPLLAAYTFIPLLISTSKQPAIQHLSSVAALIPAPTRAIYASTKSGALVGLRALAIEQPAIKWSFVIPATIEGDFRRGAVDAGEVKEKLDGALKSDYVAKECVRAVDEGKKMMILPRQYWLFYLLSYIIPSVVERGARKKYAYTAPKVE